MLPPEQAAQFGWAIVCHAVKEVLASAHGPLMAAEPAPLHYVFYEFPILKDLA